MIEYSRAPRCRLVIMVKSPVAGRVKTRLARAVGDVAATAFYRRTARAVVGRLARDARWQTILAVAPDTDLNAPFWPPWIPRVPQGDGDLGRRMQRLIELMPTGPVILIGTDIPAVVPDHVAGAFKLLRRHGTVFGPANDGGFWLIGQRRTPRPGRYFDGVRWSTEYTLADCTTNLAGDGHAFATELSDVDTAEGFAEAAPWCGRLLLPK